MTKELTTRYSIEYTDEKGKLESRWTYDHSVTTNGPVVVEQFQLPPKQKRKKFGERN